MICISISKPQTWTGGAGNDTLTGNNGIDTLDGGAGNDTIVATDTEAAADTVKLESTTASTSLTNVTGAGNDTGTDTVTGFDTANDTLVITAAGVVNFVHATDTNFRGSTTAADGTGVSDLASTAFAFDFDSDDVVGETGELVVNMSSLLTSGVAYTLTSDTADTALEAKIQYVLTGTAAVNTITGGDLADSLSGGAAADTLTGGKGADTIIGGAGADVIVFSDTNGSDVITFVINEDKMDFTDITGITGVSGDLVSVAADAATTDLGDGLIIIFADGADGAGDEVIADYADLTDVAAFLAAGLTETNGESYIALINDDTGEDFYAYLVNTVAGGSIDATEVTLIGTAANIGGIIIDLNEVVAA